MAGGAPDRCHQLSGRSLHSYQWVDVACGCGCVERLCRFVVLAPKDIQVTIYNRPAALQSTTYRVPTDHGNMYVTLGTDDGRLVEIWIAISKSGSCEKAFLEALARSIALGLQRGVPLVEYVEQLQGITCHVVGDGTGFVHSPADGLAKVLKGASSGN